MADYWKSQPKKFCIYCKCWIADNKPSIEFHERGKNHKENVIKKISEIKQKSVAKAKQDDKNAKEFAAMEEAALKAYEEDLKRLEGTTKPAPIAPVGLTVEERRARDEQKWKEIDAIEKHHAKRQWTKASSPEGYPYYYNTLTGGTQWEEPEGFQGSSEKSEEQGAKSVWTEGVSDEGYTYYYNSETGESRWEKPDDFESSVSSGKDERDSSTIQDTAADTGKEAAETEKKSANQELEPEAPSNETKSGEDTTAEAPVTKTHKINFQSKKEEQENNDKVSETDGQEEGTESKEQTDEKTEKKSQNLSSKRSRRTNPYGVWEEVKQEQDPYENVDLELPNIEYDDPPTQVPDIPEEPKVKFKEKTITSLGDTAPGASVFKKRRLDNVKSRNIRQRLDDQ